MQVLRRNRHFNRFIVRLFYIFCSFDFSSTFRTPLRSSEDLLVKLLGLGRGDLRAGQLGVDVVRDGPHGGRQSAAATAQVAGRQLHWGEVRLDSWKRRSIETALMDNFSDSTSPLLASKLDKVLE